MGFWRRLASKESPRPPRRSSSGRSSTAADSLATLILNRLRQDGDLEEGISPNYLVRNWPPAFKEWSIKSVRDAFFASPQKISLKVGVTSAEGISDQKVEETKVSLRELGLDDEIDVG